MTGLLGRAPPGYHLQAEIGRGGMGVVYRALQLELKREVALKCLLPGAVRSPQLLARFRREAIAMSQVNHPGLVKLFDVGQDLELPYLAMELVPGTTLTERLRRDPAEIAPRAGKLVRSLLEALAAMHAQGLTHRDIKPGNVMVRPDLEPVLMDLGLVKDLGNDGTLLTDAGSLVGTPSYLSPELLGGAPASFASDLWSVGCLYFEIATGARLFNAATAAELCRCILESRIPDLSVACPGLSEQQRRFLACLLARSPADRPRDALHALDLFRKAEASASRRVPALRATAATVENAARRRPGWLPFGLAGTAVLVALVAHERSQSQPPPAGPLAAVVSPEPVRPGASPPVSAREIPVTDDAYPFARGWDFHADYYRKLLELGGKPAQRAQLDIQRRAGVPLASMPPESSVRFLDLGRWLATGFRREDFPASFRQTSRMKVAQQLLVSTSSLFAPRHVAVILLCERPSEMRGWLALGHVLDAAGDHGAAQRAYAYALERPMDELGAEWPRYMVAALIRAALVVPGASLERSWPGWVARSEIESQGWSALRDVFQGGDQARLDQVFRASEAHCPTDRMYLMWWKLRMAVDGARRAREILYRGRQRLPGAVLLEEAIITDAASRGVLDEARPHVFPRTIEHQLGPLEIFLADGGPPRGAVSLDAARGLALRPALDRLLEDGGESVLPQILSHIERENLGQSEHVVLWALDALGAGHRHPQLTELAAQAIGRGLPNWMGWELEGSLASDDGEPWMERILSRPDSALGPVDARRALWLCRRGRYAAALRSFEQASAASLKAWPPGIVVELAARPVWAAALGLAVEPEAPSRARTCAERLLDGSLPMDSAFRDAPDLVVQRQFLAAVAAGRLADALAPAAELFERQPNSALWGEAVAWSALLADDPVAFERQCRRLRAAAYFAGTSTWAVRRLASLAAGRRRGGEARTRPGGGPVIPGAERAATGTGPDPREFSTAGLAPGSPRPRNNSMIREATIGARSRSVSTGRTTLCPGRGWRAPPTLLMHLCDLSGWQFRSRPTTMHGDRR